VKAAQTLVLICLLSAAACSQPSAPAPEPDLKAPAATPEAPSASAEAESGISLPDYTVVERRAAPPYKLAIDVRLPEKVSKEDLAAIAKKLKSQEADSYDRIFILYYLPDMVVGSGAWASTHFNPTLEVKILGLSADAEKAAAAASQAIENKIGVWMDERPYVGATNVLYSEDGRLKLKTTYMDGSGSLKTLVETSDTRGRKFEDEEGNDFGEYYILEPDGDLSLYDNEGFILSMHKKS